MTKVSDPSSEGKMDVGEAAILIREIARPLPVKTVLGVIADALSWSPNRIRDVWHADTRVRLSKEETAELRLAVQRKREEQGAAEYRALRERLDRIEAILRASGQDVAVPANDLGGE